MILIRRFFFLILLILAGLAIVGIGVRGHQVILRTGSGAASARLDAEALLFGAIVATLAIGIAGLGLMLKAVNVTARLNRVIELSRFGSVSIQHNLARLGPLGKQLERLYHSLGELGEKRALKISALSGACGFLLDNIDRAILVADPQGVITEASRAYLEQAERREMKGRPLAEVISSESFAKLAARVEHTRSLVAIEEPPAQLFPVFNREGELAAVICVMDDKPLATAQTAALAAPRARGRLWGRLLESSRRVIRRPAGGSS